MNKLWTYIFRQTKLGQFVDGKKTYLGLLILALYHGANFFVDASSVMPDVENFSVIAIAIQSFLSTVIPYLGSFVTSVGVIDKIVKRFSKK